MKTRSLKSRKIEIFPKELVHGFGKKKGHFSVFFIWGNLGQENVFYDILEVEESKNWDFSKGVTQRLLSKKGHFSVFFIWGNLGQENVFYDMLEQKNTFLGYKNKKLKKSKNWDFSMVLVKRGPFFRLFYLRKFLPGKCVLWYSRTKKHISSL